MKQLLLILACLMLLGAAPASQSSNQPDRTVFIIDDNGSMMARGWKEIGPQVEKMVNDVDSKGHFAFLYLTSTKPKMIGNGMLPASDHWKKAAGDSIKKAESVGTTAISPGITEAFRMNPKELWMVTNGTSDDMLDAIAAAKKLNPKSKVVVNVLLGPSSKNETELKNLAEETGGKFVQYDAK